MIISASRRTDIPAFFGRWFMERVRQGFFYQQNPFNPSQVKRIPLDPEVVEAIVFWTKDPRPFLPYLPRLDEHGFRYYFQFTLNAYPLWLEPVAPLSQRLDAFLRLSDALGPRRVCWRYDPIILTSDMGVEYHVDVLEQLARRLQTATARLTASWLDDYGKVKRRLERVGRERGVRFWGRGERPEACDALQHRVLQLARQHRLELVTCAEVWQHGVGMEGSCIDGSLIEALFGLSVPGGKDRGQRTQCRCSPSVDMGVYDSCSHLCLYCYAHRGEKSVKKRVARHDSESPYLIG